MKVVQTFWTKPIRVKSDQQISKAFNAGWLEPRFHLMSWALSCLKLSQFYPRTSLMTDSYGKEILIDLLGLPYQEVQTDLDEIEEYSASLWALSKVFAYGRQEEPFIHVDSDVYIWGAFEKALVESELIAQNLDCNHPSYIDAIGAMKKLDFRLPEYVEGSLQKSSIFAANAGVIGGQDWPFFKAFSDSVFEFIHQNEDRLRQLPRMEILNIAFEQFFYWCFAQQQQRSIHYWSPRIEYGDPPQHYVRFWGVPKKTQYIHMIFNYKTSPSLLHQLEQRLKLEFPDYYYRIMAILENFEL